MNCPNCSSLLELYSLEYKWVNGIMHPKGWYYCLNGHQLCVMKDKQLVNHVPVAEATVNDEQEHVLAEETTCPYCNGTGGTWEFIIVKRNKRDVFGAKSASLSSVKAVMVWERS